jgi:citrate synthase
MFAKTLNRGFSKVLKQKMEHVIAGRQKELIAFRKEHSETVVGQINVGQILGGMRGMPGMLYETSKLHPENGISYRGVDLFELREKGAKTVAGGQPIPEGALWLLLTGEQPSESEITEFKEEIFKRGALTAQEEKLIQSFPNEMHGMT